MPGVMADKVAEGIAIRHCALSLVSQRDGLAGRCGYNAAVVYCRHSMQWCACGAVFNHLQREITKGSHHLTAMSCACPHTFTCTTCTHVQVGEPIMYPEINALVDELHSRHISTFLVTNAQFPDRIQQVSMTPL